MIYKFGQVATVAFSVTVTGVQTDPSSIVTTLTSPSGVVTSDSWPSGGVTRTGVGAFSTAFVCNESGVWTLEVDAAGLVVVDTVTSILVDGNTSLITVSVVDQNNAPLADVMVTVYADALTIAGTCLTSSLGTGVLRLKAGSYSVNLAKRRVVFAPATLVVTGPATVAYTGTVLAITEGAGPRLVRLFGVLSGSDGRPLGGAVVQISRVGDGAFVLGTDTSINPISRAVVREQIVLETDEDGYWEEDVVAGLTYRVQILAAGLIQTFRIPSNIAVLNFADVRPDPGPGAGMGVDFDITQREDRKGGG